VVAGLRQRWQDLRDVRVVQTRDDGAAHPLRLELELDFGDSTRRAEATFFDYAIDADVLRADTNVHPQLRRHGISSLLFFHALLKNPKVQRLEVPMFEVNDFAYKFYMVHGREPSRLEQRRGLVGGANSPDLDRLFLALLTAAKSRDQVRLLRTTAIDAFRNHTPAGRSTGAALFGVMESIAFHADSGDAFVQLRLGEPGSPDEVVITRQRQQGTRLIVEELLPDGRIIALNQR